MVIAGLILNIAGTLLLVFFSFPQPQHEGDVPLALEDATPVEGGTTTAGELRTRAQKRKTRYRWLAYLGLLLLVIGFILQLIANV